MTFTAPYPSSAQPMTLLAGGHWHPRNTPDPLLRDCLAQAGTLPSIAYIGAASEEDPAFFRRLANAFKDAGAGAVRLIPLASSKANIPSARHDLMESDLIFISGGDVKAGMHCLEQHGIPPLLRQLHQAGKPFFGLSAGSIMLAQHWVDWDNPDDDTTAASFQCLGLAPLICDTHAEDDDWVELKMLLRLLPEGVIGFGIPTGGGLRVNASGILALGQPLQRFHKAKNRVRELTPISQGTLAPW